MLRIRDFFMRREESPEEPRTRTKRPPVRSAPDPEANRFLYQTLVQTVDHCFASVRARRTVDARALIVLSEQLLDQLDWDDTDLIRLSTMEPGAFTLATHCVNVAILAVRVGMESDFRRDELIELALACLLHDVGMVELEGMVQNPTFLTKDQRKQLQRHPETSCQLLEGSKDLPDAVSRIIAQEHERDDGSGYPLGLKGDAIDERAKILGMMDVYEALTHDRPHRSRVVPSEAMRTLVHDHRSKFTRDGFRALLQSVPIYPVGSWVKLNTGEAAQVIRVSRLAPLQPTVVLRRDIEGRTLLRQESLDLTRERRYQILEAIREPNS